MDKEILCKICNIKDFDTALFCAESGADFLGLHGIWQIKQDDILEFKKICLRIPILFPKVSTVLVTRQQEIEKILQMIDMINPHYVQLHSSWLASDIHALRERMDSPGHRETKIIGVIALGEELVQRIESISNVVDLLLFDSSIRGGSGCTFELTIAAQAIELAKGTPVFIAGGLTPENVCAFIDYLKPAGVDVQTGVEYPGKPGLKDRKRLLEFIKKVKAFK